MIFYINSYIVCIKRRTHLLKTFCQKVTSSSTTNYIVIIIITYKITLETAAQASLLTTLNLFPLEKTVMFEFLNTFI